MNAYDQPMSMTEQGGVRAAKGSPGGPEVLLKKTKAGSVEQTTSNPYLLMTAAGEFFILLGVITMNVLFRFVESTRDSASMIDYTKVIIFQIDQHYYRPYFDYSLTLEQNQNETIRRTFGIKFTMQEYAFQVPVFILPLLVIACVETVRHFYSPRQVKLVQSVGVNFPMGLRRGIRFYYSFLLFGGVAGIFASLVKLLIPVARPHFAAVFIRYIADGGTMYNMTGAGEIPEVREALRSFPSYHATIAVYSGAFLCLYLHHCISVRGQYSATVACFVPILVMTGIGALHRVVTYHAFYRDVLWGGLLGLAMAVYAVYGVLNTFQERNWTVLSTTGHRTGVPHGPTSPSRYMEPSPSPLSMGTTNYGYGVHDDFSDAPVPQPRHQPLAKTSVQYQMPGRPTQAFNASMIDDKPSKQADYNRPRQRYSMPSGPDGQNRNYPPPPPPPDRRRSPSRFEGASYL